MKLTITLLSIVSCLFFPKGNFAQTPNLRSAGFFTLFTTTGAVGNTGISDVNGKIGTNNGAITGFTPEPGQMENGNAVTILAASDLLIAYTEIYTMSQTFPTHGPVLGNGEILNAGVYLIAEAASIEGELILDAQGDQNAVFVFQIQGAFSPGPSSKISLADGATACNVYWVVEGGAVAIATLAEMKGTFIANPGAVSMAATAQLDGRLLSTTGAVAVDGITANLPACLVLPVTLLDFKAMKNQKVIELSWTVADEISFAGYELERSADGRNFNKVVTIAPTNSTSIKTYNWSDNDPLSLLNFYRLKMVNLDRGFKYSMTLKVAMDPKMKIFSYPNPVVDHNLSLQLNGQFKGEYNLSIYNLQGKKVMNSKLLIGENDDVKNISLDRNLLPGMYVLELVDRGNNKQSIKFILK